MSTGLSGTLTHLIVALSAASSKQHTELLGSAGFIDLGCQLLEELRHSLVAALGNPPGCGSVQPLLELAQFEQVFVISSMRFAGFQQTGL